MNTWWQNRTEKFKKTILVSGFGFLILAAWQAKLLAQAVWPEESINKNVAATNEVLIDKTVKHIKTPAEVHGLYISAAAAGSQLVNGLLEYVLREKMNTVVIDTKDWLGRLAFIPKDPKLKPFVSDTVVIKDLEKIIKKFHDHGIYVIARNFVFEDPSVTYLKPEWALARVGGGVWADYKGVRWLDSSNVEVWKYNVRLAREAYNRGFDEIQFDYIRFPSDGNLSTIKYKDKDAATPKYVVMNQFFNYLDRNLHPDIPISADLFGMTLWRDDDMNIGQRFQDALPHFDWISPMIYPSHFPNTFEGYANPAANPYDIIYKSMMKAKTGCQKFGMTTCGIRPWLQDFNLGANYGPDEVRAQIKAVKDAGFKDWLIWNAANRYTTF